MIAQTVTKPDIRHMHTQPSFPSLLLTWAGLRLLVVLLVAGLVAACSLTPRLEEPEVKTRSSDPLKIHPADFNPAPFRGLDQTLVLGILTAELAGQRNQLDLALDTYLQLALKTRHPDLAERTVWIAQFAQEPQAALQAALIWSRAAPENLDAQRTTAGLLLQNEHYLEAFEQLVRYERLGGESNFALLAGHLTESGNPVVDDLYQLMLEEHQQRERPSTDLLTALALLSEERGRLEEAQSYLTLALELEPQQLRALQLQARLDRRQGNLDAALHRLQAALEIRPDEVRLWLELARTQLQNQQLEEAESSFDRIIQLQPDNPHIRLALARIQLETQQYVAAKKSLKALTEDPLLADQAWIHLAELAELEGDYRQALDYYSQVKQGQPLLDALQASLDIYLARNETAQGLQILHQKRQQHRELLVPLTLMGEQVYRQAGELNLALQWIDEGRALEPREEPSLRLLYARALLHYQLEQLDAMEADLKQLLQQDPNNAMALNALGYTLVNHTQDRLEEGYQLIQQAHALNPNSPEILDSLGWALFHLGRLEEAREYLEEAYQRLPDEEIAAHLIETLWELGEFEEAQRLTQQLLQLEEPTPTLDELLLRRPEIQQ